MKTLRHVKGFTILETSMVFSIIVILAAVALPIMTSLMGSVEESQARQIVDAGNVALMLDFSRQIMEGVYTSPLLDDKQKIGKKLRQANQEVLEAMLIPGFSYPVGFQWVLVEQATSTQPPVVGYRSI